MIKMRCYGACRLNKQGDNDKNEVLYMGRVASTSKVIMIKMRCYGACHLNKQGDNDKNEVLWGVSPQEAR